MVNRIKQLSNKILESYGPMFGVDFVDNKKVLEEISIIRSKELKNELAGYITKFVKREKSRIKDQEVPQEVVVDEPEIETFGSVAEMEAAGKTDAEASE